MEDIPWSERRRFTRLRSNNTLHYVLKPDGNYANTITQDISEGGVRITTHQFIPKLSRMIIQLSLETDKVIDITGKVAWSQQVPFSDRYQAGLEFMDVNPKIREDIAKYIAMNSDR